MNFFCNLCCTIKAKGMQDCDKNLPIASMASTNLNASLMNVGGHDARKLEYTLQKTKFNNGF
jgi:hypothetical protein